MELNPKVLYLKKQVMLFNISNILPLLLVLLHEDDVLKEHVAEVDKQLIHQIVLLDNKQLFQSMTADKTEKLHALLNNYVMELFLSSMTIE